MGVEFDLEVGVEDSEVLEVAVEVSVEDDVWVVVSVELNVGVVEVVVVPVGPSHDIARNRSPWLMSVSVSVTYDIVLASSFQFPILILSIPSMLKYCTSNP